MPGVILFDFFGTLVRYEPDRTALTYPDSHAIVTEWGCELTHDDFVQLWNAASNEIEVRTATSHEELRMIDYAGAFGRRCDRVLTPEQCEELAGTFVAEWSRHVRPIPGTAELLVELAGSFRLGIVSNTNDSEMVPRLVRAHFSSDLVEMVLLSVEHGVRKPHPSIYTTALSWFGCDPSQAAFVGDSYEADYLGPTTAGLRGFLIDPDRRYPIPDASRLDTVLDLASRL